MARKSRARSINAGTIRNQRRLNKINSVNESQRVCTTHHNVRHDASYSRSLCQNHQLQMIISEGLCFVDHQFCIESLSKEAQRILGLDEFNVVGESLFNLIKIISHNINDRTIDEMYLRVHSKNKSVFRDDDCLLFQTDNSQIPVSIAFSPIYVDDKFNGALIALRDISQLKKIEESLLERTSAAEKQAAYRAAQLIRSEDELKHQAVRLAYQAKHDDLTGLYNRRYFETKLEKLIENANRFDVEHVLLYLDLDQFKIINDSCGHIAGDELLRQVSLLIKNKVREWDVVSRLGGDEFGIQLLYCTKKSALCIAEELLEVIQKHRFLWNGLSHSLTTSIGMVSLNKHTKCVNSIMTQADNACYIAKDDGRDRIYLYQETDQELQTRFGEINCVASLTNALDNNRLRLFYQPIMPLNESADDGLKYELLLRILDEDDNYILPANFLPAAERYNLISRIDRWVVNEACHLLEQYPQHLEQLSSVSINISGQSLNDDRFLSYVEDILEESTVPTEKLCFEITETGAIANLSNAIRFIERFQALGVKFSLDDFGSGLSSFAYLKNLPVDHLKIDGMFVRNMGYDEVDFAMVKSIHDLCKVMGKTTIAEFVEDQETIEKLQAIGVDYAQGYAIARPQPLLPFLEGEEE